jgi:hypothetical protein
MIPQVTERNRVAVYTVKIFISGDFCLATRAVTTVSCVYLKATNRVGRREIV